MPTYCTINEVYGPNFNKKDKKQPPPQPTKKDKDQAPIQKVSLQDGIGPMNGEKLVCPTCKQCLKDNNWFQQQVVKQATWPLPRWIPQSQTNVNVSPYDPWSRYYGPTDHSIEHFGNIDFFPSFLPQNRYEYFGHNEITNKAILKILLYFLIALFTVSLIEIILKMC